MLSAPARRAVIYEDVEVVDAAATGMIVRIGNARTFVGRYVPAEGTTIRHAGDRGRLALPQWFVERHGLPLSRHERPEANSEMGTAMPQKKGEAAVVQLATRVSPSLLLRMKIHCVQREQSMMEFVAEAIREKLKRAAVRVVPLAMSAAALLAA